MATTKDTEEYDRGYADGYAGDSVAQQTEDYLDGWDAGSLAFWQDNPQYEPEPEPEGFVWSDVDQGRWDDDPNPYHGDYSEM